MSRDHPHIQSRSRPLSLPHSSPIYTSRIAKLKIFRNWPRPSHIHYTQWFRGKIYIYISIFRLIQPSLS